MTNTVAHTPPKPGTSRRLGLRPPHSVHRYGDRRPLRRDEYAHLESLVIRLALSRLEWRGLYEMTGTGVVVGPREEYGIPYPDGAPVSETGQFMYCQVRVPYPDPVRPKPPTIVADGPDAGRMAYADQAYVEAIAESHGRKVKAMAEYLQEKWTGTGLECCDVMHTRDTKTGAWLPGCAHLGSA